MSRSSKKNKLFDRMFDIMKDRPDLCGDDVHKVEGLMFAEEYGINLTYQQIIFLYSVIRMRRNVLVKHPEMDTRSETFALEAEDRSYYSPQGG